ncbi:unnamed protein product [Arctia plantaginis]|uniref:Uncharacterized protein n=1 Tax=Arctia plantaginis TaxID=874455 RepID=A0A8S0ZF64_ARCPL|nr:unnamed protein product [Arctia plantaginis]CAB3237413.1 unnamed protein product [Arctia plantaginis]
MEHKWVGIFFIVIVSQITAALSYEEEDTTGLQKRDRPQVEVRAVFINCQPEVLNIAPESEATRFERDELFKHNVLKDCIKKLALTVKITSEAGDSGDEYIPIEHVFEDSEKRVRLLDPYILRLRREMPRQAYLLRRLDTVSCVVTNDAVHDVDDNNIESTRSRIQRDAEHNSDISHVNVNKADVRFLQSYSTQLPGTSLFTTVLMERDNCGNYCSIYLKS